MSEQVTKDEEATLGPLRIDLMARIGVVLLNVQTTELALRLITTYVLQKSSPITAEQLIAQSNAEQKKTLGYFFTELRKRADIDVHFDNTLTEFLRRRNVLAHSLSDIPGWNTDTRHGIYVGRRFINELHDLNNEVLKVFGGLIRAWQVQAGDNNIGVPDHPIFKEIDTKYVPLVDSLFSAKEPD